MSEKPSFAKVDWKNAHPESVVLISGPENYFAERVISKIKKNLLEADESLVVSELEGDTYAAGELLTLASPSLFGEPRMIIANRVEKCNDAFLEECKNYVLSPNSDTTLILRHTSGARGRALLDAVRKKSPAAIEINCPEIKPRDRGPIVRDEIKMLGGRIENSSLIMLLEAYQSDFDELMSVTRQLVQISDGLIDDKHVEHITGGRVEANAFRVADAAIAGNAKQAVVLLRQSLDTGTGAFPLLGALNLKVRTMAKLYGFRGSVADSAKEFSIAPWQAQKALNDVRGWRENDLARAVDLAAATELQMKGGSRDPIYALEKYVLFIARKGRKLSD